MARLIETPTIVAAAGHPPKRIEEFIGRARTGSEALSIARMTSPPGWAEPGQTPDFDEYTLVLRGTLQAETSTETFVIKAGQAFLAERGEWIRYSTPGEDGAEYIAICAPAFSLDTVHRDDD